MCTLRCNPHICYGTTKRYEGGVSDDEVSFGDEEDEVRVTIQLGKSEDMKMLGHSNGTSTRSRSE